MYHVFAICLAICSLTSALTFTKPAAGNTIDLAKKTTIAWTTNSSDPSAISLLFSGHDFASVIALRVDTNALSYVWDADQTSSELSSFNTTLYTGYAFQIAAGLISGDGGILAQSANFSVKDYNGPTNTTSDPSGSGAAATSGRCAGLVVMGAIFVSFAAALL